ncbi:MAG TPA: hypothetical protein VJQ55_04555 [Candidatus Binatia bacterium]|nr:hypothetical protein [Candidatus Binatia bacterium]
MERGLAGRLAAAHANRANPVMRPPQMQLFPDSLLLDAAPELPYSTIVEGVEEFLYQSELLGSNTAPD